MFLVVFDFMVYPDPKFLTFKTFSEVRDWFFDPMLSRKAFATNSLNWKFL